MVEYALQLDSVFYSLSDPTRRDILQRVADSEYTISELAHKYDMSFAAVSKHIQILQKAKLVLKRKEGKQQMVSLAPSALKSADEYLEQYRQMWQSRFDKLESLLNEKE